MIVGNGKVGFSLAEQLVSEKYDVTIVDMRDDALRRASDALDIMSVKGNGVSAATLLEAGAQNADLLVAATNSDEVNMVCCLTAKRLGSKYTIARIRNPEYNAGLHDLKKNMGIDMVINPETPPPWRSPGCCASPLRPTSRPSAGAGWSSWASACSRTTFW